MVAIDAEFEERDKEEKPSTALGPVVPMNVMVGKNYRMVIDNYVTKVKVEKIYMGLMGKTYITFTMRRKGKMFATYTTSLDAEDFKLRVLGNGIEQIEL